MKAAENKKTGAGPEEFPGKYGERAVLALLELAEDEATNDKLRADIWKWFAEMRFGKPSQPMEASADVDFDALTYDLFSGGGGSELEAWSK